MPTFRCDPMCKSGLSMNPSFASGGSVVELVDAGLLHRECEQVFRVKEHESDPGRLGLTFHRHQRDAKGRSEMYKPGIDADHERRLGNEPRHGVDRQLVRQLSSRNR